MNEYNNRPSHLCFETKPHLGVLCERNKAVQTLQIDQERPSFSPSVFLRNISSCGCLHKAQCSCWISHTNEYTPPLPFSLPTTSQAINPECGELFYRYGQPGESSQYSTNSLCHFKTSLSARNQKCPLHRQRGQIKVLFTRK